MTKSETFRNLHKQNKILQIGNVWDLQSAIIFQKQNYKALGSSSAAIANSLGLEDGEEIDFEELVKIVKQITSKVDLPLSVDIESGFAQDTNKIIENIKSLYNNGAVGINIEDSIIKPKRELANSEEFSEKIKEIKQSLKKQNIDIFLNIRIDCYILNINDALSETIKRIKLYEKAGADGLFVPCLVDIEDINKVVQATNLPVNIMAMPNLPSFEQLNKVGIKRVSQGPFVYENIIMHFSNILKTINKENSFQGIY